MSAGGYRNSVPSVSRASQFCLGRNLELLWRGAKDRSEGVGPQECVRTEGTIREVGGEYLCCAGSCRCHLYVGWQWWAGKWNLYTPGILQTVASMLYQSGAVFPLSL